MSLPATFSAWQTAFYMLKLSLPAIHCKPNLPVYSVLSACQTAFQMMSLPANVN